MSITADTRPLDASQMLAEWEQARARGRNNRAAAAELGLTEAELIASGCGRFVTRLLPEALALLRNLPLLGEVKAIVRNPSAVIERAGVVLDVRPSGVGAILVEADQFEMACQLAE